MVRHRPPVRALRRRGGVWRWRRWCGVVAAHEAGAPPPAADANHGVRHVDGELSGRCDVLLLHRHVRAILLLLPELGRAPRHLPEPPHLRYLLALTVRRLQLALDGEATLRRLSCYSLAAARSARWGPNRLAALD